MAFVKISEQSSLYNDLEKVGGYGCGEDAVAATCLKRADNVGRGAGSGDANHSILVVDAELLQVFPADINTEDKKVALAVENALPAVEKLVSEIVPRMKRGGRIFYIGAGTSGRLGAWHWRAACSPSCCLSHDPS